MNLKPNCNVSINISKTSRHRLTLCYQCTKQVSSKSYVTIKIRLQIRFILPYPTTKGPTCQMFQPCWLNTVIYWHITSFKSTNFQTVGIASTSPSDVYGPHCESAAGDWPRVAEAAPIVRTEVIVHARLLTCSALIRACHCWGGSDRGGWAVSAEWDSGDDTFACRHTPDEDARLATAIWQVGASTCLYTIGGLSYKFLLVLEVSTSHVGNGGFIVRAPDCRNLASFVHPTLPVFFGRYTESRWSLLPGVYARGSKNDPRLENEKICRGPTNSREVKL